MGTNARLSCQEQYFNAGTAKHEFRIRKHQHWSPYVADLIHNVQTAMRRHLSTRKLRFLLYPKGLLPADEARIRRADAGVIWL